MLIILFSAIILLIVLSGIGKLNSIIFKKPENKVSKLLILGVFTVSTFWLLLCFFIPINLAVETITLVIGISSFFYFRVYLVFWHFFSNHWKLFSPIALLIIFSGSYFPFIMDHFGYYLPTIKWLSEFGLVKGISNLDLLLGQMSVWHIFQAGFSHFTDPFLRLNAVVIIIYLFYIFEKKSWIHLVFIPFLFLFSQSPSPDLPVIVFSLIVLNEILFQQKNISFLFALSVWIFAIKPTMIWVPIFAFFYAVLITKSNIKFILTGSFVLLLYFAKNLWCFGFPVFPVSTVDLGLSWKPNPELLKISSQTAIEKTFDMQYSYSEIQKFTTFEYIKNWLFLKGIKSKIHLLFIFSLIGFSVLAFKKKDKMLTMLFFAILIKSVLVLIFSAQYRFFLDVFFVLIFVLFYQMFSRKIAIPIFFVFSLFFLSFISFPNMLRKYIPSFKLGQFMMGFQKEQILKPAYFEWKKYKTHQIGNTKFNVVKQYPFSFDIPIPAISPEFIKEDLEAGIFPEQNSKNLKDGYHWRKISEAEKQKLREILKEFEN